ncbi:hypothetical protein GMORB2_3929 [Geosmithia morbida]|uniref:Uncharacterized protein n=1 Tax=Geosmithia morbida TaxID=1094350 RepID=A0A9P5D6T3_9HYPO|nr:uncharacterized protein GMORB2_3929 [Geosmithia morbida]KAF4125090.1 hypothetical protein GMORB2_3929 [Geosmithia morbida]
MRDRLIKGPIARIKGRKSAVASKIRRRRWGIAKAYKRRMPTVEEDLPGDDDDGDNNDNCRRSGRDRRPVDFLGKIPWSEVLGFDVQNPLAASLYAEGVFDDGDGYESINSEEDEGEDEAEEEEEQAQSLPTPPESGHDTSDNEPHPWQSLLPTPGPAATEASQSSDRITTIPDSQGTEQSPLPVRTISRPQRQPTPEPPSVRVEYATGDASCMLSDDEQPVLFKRPKRKLQQLQQPSKQKPPQEKASGFAAISSRPQPSTAVAAYTTTAPLTTPTEAELPKKRGRPRKASTEKEPPASLPPDDGALRKKLKVSAEGHASKQMPKATFAPNAAAEGTKRKRGRLRKEPLPDPERCPAPVPSTQTLPDGPATIKSMTAVGSAEDEETGPLGEVTGHGQPTLGEIELGEPFDDQSTAAPLENEQPRLATDKADTLPVDASPRADTSLPVASPPGTPAPSSDDLLLDASTPSTSVPDEFTLEACLPDVFVPKKSAPDAPTSVSNDPVTVAEKPTPNEAAMDASAPHEPVPNVDAPATYTPAPNAPSEPAVDKSAPSIEAPDVVSVPEDEPVPYVPQFETATSEMSVTKTPTPVIPAPSPEYKSPSPSVVVERAPTPKVLTPKAATPVESMPVIALPNDPTPRECTPKVPSPRVLTPRAPRPKSPTPERPTPKTSAPTISAPSVPGKSTPRHTPDRVIQDSQETDSSPAKPQTPPKDSNITQRAEPPASSKEEGRRRLFKETPPAAAAAAQETASGSRAAAVAAPASRDGSRQRPAEKVVVAIPDGTEAATSLKKPAEKIRQQPTTHEHTGPRATSSPTPPLQGRQGQQPKLKLKLRPKPKPQSQLQPQAQPPPPQPRQQRHSPPTVVASGTAKPKHRDTTRLSSSSSRRRSILSLVPPTGPSSFSSSKKNRSKSYIDDDDDDDDDFLGRADDTVSVSKLFSSNTPQPPAAREKLRCSGDAQTTTEVSVAKDGGSGSSGSSSSRKRRRSEAAAAGPKKMCGVDGYKCGKDFCFTCL